MIKFAKQKFYIATAIDYTNSSPHLGHAYQKIAADVQARWKKSQGFDVFLLTGTDEHGIKVQRAAEAAGLKPKELVDNLAKEFKDAWDKLNVKYDRFIRTTDKDHEKAVQEFVEKVKHDIYKGTYSGHYCVGCETYLSDDEIIQGKCHIHKKPVEFLKEETYFFKLSKYQDKIAELIEKNPRFVLPKYRRDEVLNRVKAGLKDLSITRTKFQWGVPFPLDKKHTTYVWFEALLSYITGIGWPKGDFKKYWPCDTHHLGKDNLWFHAVIWPAMLYSAGIEPPKTVFVNGWITIEGEKISKSLGNVIDPRELVKEFGADAIRYYLLREGPYGEDLDFRRAALVTRINTDLANDLGNLVSRTLTLIEKFSGGKVPKPASKKPEEVDFIATLDDKQRHVSEHIEKFEFHHALEKIWEFIKSVNKYVDSEKPWVLAKEQDEHLHTVLYNCAEALRIISALTEPFIPETAEKIAKQLGLDAAPKLKGLEWGQLKVGTKVQKSEVLFKKVELKEERQEPFSKLDIRCALITDVLDIEGADKLYKLTLDLGNLGKRTVVAGLKKYYEPNELKDKKVAMIANLEPAVIRGQKSEGMILAAADKDTVEALFLQKTLPGEKIFAEGLEGKPASFVPYEEFAKIAINVNDGKILHDGKSLRSAKEEINVKLKEGKVR